MQPESCILLQEPLSILSWGFQWWSWGVRGSNTSLHPGGVESQAAALS